MDEKIADYKVIIMAAGIGSRFGGLKQLVPIGPNNETILHYSINDAIRAGFKNFIFIIRKDIEKQFKEIICKPFEDKINMEFAYQELNSCISDQKLSIKRVKPWGTGHAVLVTKDMVKDNFIVINADDYYGPLAYKIIYSFFREGNKANKFAMIGYKLSNTLSKYGGVSRGICEVTDDMYLKKITELKQVREVDGLIKCINASGNILTLTGEEITSMNFWAFTPFIYKYLEIKFEKFLAKYYKDNEAEFYLPRAVNELIQEGIIEVKVYITTDKWYGITYPDDVRIKIPI